MQGRILVAAFTIAACAPSAKADSSEAQPAGAPVLSWSFEPASADCNGWDVRGASAIRASPARTGAYSCKLCSDGSAPAVELGRDLGEAEPGRYLLTAWVRRRPQNEAPPNANVRLDATVAGASVSAAARAVDVREEWDRLETTLVVPVAASSLRLAIRANASEKDRCLFVDDVELTRE